jgi:hypothetical protein
VLLERSHEVGIHATDMAALQLQDVTIRDTRPRACGTGWCADAPAGTGLGSYGGASVEMTSLLIEQSSLCGIQIAGGGTVDLADGEVSGNSIGACVQVDGYDLDRLTDGVLYRANGTNIDLGELPVPEPAPTL